MLKRAGIFSIVGLVAALFGFTGLLRATDGFAQTIFFGCAALTFLSLLFSLFEEQSIPHSPPAPLTTPQSNASSVDH